jgi:amino acid transporter
VGNFTDAAMRNCGVRLSALWIVVGVGTILLAAYCAFRDMKLAARLMLSLEGLSVLAIILLSMIILAKVVGTTGLSVEPFVPSNINGWSGVGYGLVFAVLSFAGFEGAATLGEETTNPYRSIPVAIVGTVVLAGLFYVFVSYAQVMGYGLDRMKALASASAPLNDLSIEYVSTNFATAIDIAAAVSAFSCALGSLSAAARLLFALGRAGLARPIGEVHAVHGTPGFAVIVCGGLCLIGILVWAPLRGAENYYDDLATIGTLALIVVYMAMTGAELADALAARRPIWSTFGILGTVALLWPLYNSVYPVPAFPGNLWPYLVVTWLVLGALLPTIRPVISAADMAET